jgi:hypothetical protein
LTNILPRFEKSDIDCDVTAEFDTGESSTSTSTSTATSYTACAEYSNTDYGGVGDWHSEQSCYEANVKDQDGNSVSATLDLSYKWCTGCWAGKDESYSTQTTNCFTETYDTNIDEKFIEWYGYSFTINGKKYEYTGDPTGKCQTINL